LCSTTPTRTSDVVILLEYEDVCPKGQSDPDKWSSTVEARSATAWANFLRSSTETTEWSKGRRAPTVDDDYSESLCTCTY